MEPVLLQRRAKLLRVWVFVLTLLALHLVSCEDQKGSAEPRDCLNSSSISVQEGNSIDISIPSEHEKELVDLFICRSSASGWENTCQFSDSGICRPLLKDFKEHITLGGKTLTLHNVSRAATGIYKVEQSGKCVAWSNVTVETVETPWSNVTSAEPRDCLHSSNIPVQEGDAINMSVPFQHEKEPVDLYIWRVSASRWENVCHFSNDSGICHTDQNYFKERITLEGKNLMFRNVSQKATGIYKVLLMSQKCVAWKNVTVKERPGSANHADSLALPICLPLAVLCIGVVVSCIVYRKSSVVRSFVSTINCCRKRTQNGSRSGQVSENNESQERESFPLEPL